MRCLAQIPRQLRGRLLHPAPQPDLDPAIEEKGNIGGGVCRDHFLRRIKATHIYCL